MVHRFLDPADMRKALHKRLTESIELYGNLRHFENPPSLLTECLRGKVADTDLEELRQTLRHLFEQLQGNEARVWVRLTHSKLLATPPRMALVFDKRSRPKTYLSTHWRSLQMANLVQHLDEFGWDTAWLCPQCGMYFVGFRRQEFCSQRLACGASIGHTFA